MRGDQPAGIDQFTPAEIGKALGDPARHAMSDGPAKTFLERLSILVDQDYDPADAIVLVIRPPGFAGRR